MTKKRVLITYATYGSGHKTVANYIYDYLQKHSDYEIKIIDLLDYENLIGLISKKAFEQNFKSQLSCMMFNVTYAVFNNKTTTIPYKQAVKAIFKNKKLQQDIADFNPDLLISTHFFGHIVMGMLNKKKITNCKIINIITDYISHEMWLKEEEQVNAIVVSNEIVKKELVDKKIPPKKIYPFGIPIKENFAKVDDIPKIKKKYKVDNDKPTFLFFAGGSTGTTFSFKYFKRMLEENIDINLIYVCGKSESLQKKAEQFVKKNNYQNVTVLGFSTEVNKLIAISDVVITKPGALNITECLESKKPMILIPGNGGQEIHNANFVCKNGFGLNSKIPRQLIKNVNKLLKKKTLMYSIHKKLEKYNDNKSVEKIYKLSVKLIGK